VKCEKGDLVTDCHSVSAGWRKIFCQLFVVYGVSDVRQTEIHTAEPLVLQLKGFEFDMLIEMVKTDKSLVGIKAE
jgi:hypothetical protein